MNDPESVWVKESYRLLRADGDCEPLPLAPYPRRELTFTGDGNLAEALGIDQERSDLIERRVQEMIDRNASKREIFTHFNTE